MKVTQNLKLPQYTEDDVFDLTVINEAHNKIDTTYKEIDTTYKEIANLREEIPKVNANAEIIDARGGQTTLGDKIRNIDSQLDNIDSQLDNKANEIEVVKKGYGTLNDFDENTRALIQGLSSGETNINAVLGIENVKNKNIKNNSISIEKTDFLTPLYPNLITSIRERGFYDPTKSDQWIDNDKYYTMDLFIGVDEGELFFSNSYKNFAYDVNGQYVKELKANFEVESGISKIRPVFAYADVDIDKCYCRKNNNSKEFTSDYLVLNGEKITKKTIDILDLKNITMDNYFNKQTVTNGYYLTDSGVLTENSALSVSDFIRVSKGDIFTLSHGYANQGCVFDNEKNFVKKINGALSTTNKAQIINIDIDGYIRLNMATNVVESFMCVGGGELPDQYKEYGFTIEYLNIQQNKPKYKKNVALGDSITYYEDKVYPNGQQEGEKATGYLTLLNKKTGIISSNKGSSGADITDGSNSIMRIGKEIDYTKYDMCTILGGTNDYGHSKVLGEVKSIGSEFDVSTFCGAYQSLIEYILSSNSNIKIYLMTPLKRNFSYPEVSELATANRVGKYLVDYVDKIIEIAELYSLPILDLYRHGGFNELNLSIFTRDGLHPVDKGYDRMTDVFIPFILNN